jgi:hypothetical protein
MKFAPLILIILASFANAATFTVGNVNNPNDSNAITLSNGTLIANGAGSVQVGYFSGVVDVPGASLATLVSTFNPYGNLLNFGAGFVGADGNGIFSGNISGTPLAAPYAGQPLYLVITNSAAGFTALGVTAATEFLVWSKPSTFASSEPSTDTINVQNAAGTLVQGGYNNFQHTFTSFGGTIAVPAYNTVTLIPEPSTFLLASLGVLGLLRRRR